MPSKAGMSQQNESVGVTLEQQFHAQYSSMLLSPVELL
jgi:hypothetical protein